MINKQSFINDIKNGQGMTTGVYKPTPKPTQEFVKPSNLNRSTDMQNKLKEAYGKVKRPMPMPIIKPLPKPIGPIRKPIMPVKPGDRMRPMPVKPIGKPIKKPNFIKL